MKSIGRRSKMQLALSCAVAVTVCALASAQAAVPKAAASGPLAGAKALMAKGSYAKAAEELEKVLKANPKSAEAQYLAGEAYFKAGNAKKARRYLRSAIRDGRGSIIAQKANTLLMKLPSDLVRPRVGPDTRMLASLFGLARTRGDGASPRPTVIDFYAAWCQPCKDMDKALDKVKKDYGEKINIMKVDIDDPKNDKLIDQYEVSPIPTVVFLNSDGEVVTYTIGYAESNVTDGIKKILD